MRRIGFPCVLLVLLLSLLGAFYPATSRAVLCANDPLVGGPVFESASAGLIGYAAGVYYYHISFDVVAGMYGESNGYKFGFAANANPDGTGGRPRPPMSLSA